MCELPHVDPSGLDEERKGVAVCRSLVAIRTKDSYQGAEAVQSSRPAWKPGRAGSEDTLPGRLAMVGVVWECMQ